MRPLEDFFREVRHSVDSTLDNLVPSNDREPKHLYQAIRWSLFGEGKRFRPTLVMAVGKVFGVPDEKLLRTAAAVEMIHTYSLIHDDLPAMDNDDLRRGRATAHKKFDEATAILAGDALQAMAFQVISEDTSISADVRLKLISELTSAAAAMVAGQQFDLDGEGKVVTGKELELIHLKKTGALISFSAKAGAIIAEASAAEIKALAHFALKLGLLFQITDDLLDVTQSTETLGKTALKDISSKKATYPSVFGIEGSRSVARKVHDQAIAALNSLSVEKESLRDIAHLVLARDS